MQNQNEPKRKKGSAMIVTTILLFIVLGLVVTLSAVTIMEMNMSSKQKSSVGAFFSADSGVEYALNKIAHSSGNVSTAFGVGSNIGSGISCPAALGGSDNCTIYLIGSDGNVMTSGTSSVSDVKAVRVVGKEGGETQRAIEAAVAGSNSEYSVSCSMTATTAWCVRVNKDNGGSSCKKTTDFNGSWSNCTAPW